MYLLFRSFDKSKSVIIAHVNYGARGKDSDRDQELVERLSGKLCVPLEVKSMRLKANAYGFEESARKIRHEFLREMKIKHGARKILFAHTADDQVETVLMRVLEGAGISGLKGIPRRTADGIERPLLDTWREEILEYLRKHRIPYRVDKSNFDTRFERNWIRHILIPMLEKRYGKAVKKRLFALGERFREIDGLLDDISRKWLTRHVKTDRGGVAIPRKPCSLLPSVVRKKILQVICFEEIGVAPNERLLESMDRLILTGGPSARLSIGNRAEIRCRYGNAVIAIRDRKQAAIAKGRSKRPIVMDGPGRYRFGVALIDWEEKGKLPAGSVKRIAAGERGAVFNRDGIRMPLYVRQLKAGDRIRPFGLDAEKKLKEIMIDRKIPREERWGRTALCDAEGTILWIPGVVRSAHAPVTASTRRTAVLRLRRQRSECFY